MTEEIPYFIKMRGCINCTASENMRRKHGTDYGCDHEIMAQCVLMGCVAYRCSLVSPFMDPEEIMRMANEQGKPEFIENAKKYVQLIKERFGEFYEEMGISLDTLIP